MTSASPAPGSVGGPAATDDAATDDAATDDAATDHPGAHDRVIGGAVAGGAASRAAVPERRFGLGLVVGGALGLLAAFVLSVERFKLAVDPSYVPSCSINPVLSCGTIMSQPQAALFGFPNPLLGIGAFVVPLLLGALLLSGTALPRWIARGWWVGLTLGLVFVLWLIGQSLWEIHALCPYCVVAWVVVITLWWTTTADALDRGLLPSRYGPLATAVIEYRALFALATLAAVAALIGIEFWSYWSTLLPG